MQSGAVSFRSKGDELVGKAKETGKSPLNESSFVKGNAGARPALVVVNNAMQREASTSARGDDEMG